MLAISTLVFTSCKDDNDPTTSANPAQVLMEHLVDTDMDLNHVLKNADGEKFVMAAPADGNLNGKYIIDLRSAQKFSEGHIANAVNVPDFKNLLTAAAESAGKPILVVCYTGQTACYATSLLRLYGYHNAQALKWGMSGWNAATDSWTGQVDNLADGNANWSFSATAPDIKVYDIPTFTSTATTGEAILKERVEYIVSQGFKTVNASDVIAAPANYFINNYFSGTDYSEFGHIDGAHRLKDLLIEPTSNDVAAMTNIDPSKDVVTYCYTGQTSAVITAYLRVLGYDAYSLTFGMNKLFNGSTVWTNGTNSTGNAINQWGVGASSKNLPLVQ
jgi:rhodanese-related sulfurtransferase